VRIRIRWLDDVTNADLADVGGKNASLGEMIHALNQTGIRVPSGFATTASAYWEFLEANALQDSIQAELGNFESGRQSLEETGGRIRQAIHGGRFPGGLQDEIRDAYRKLSKHKKVKEAPVAVRSSATAEDLPEASFAGQLESYLNVRGDEEVLAACQKCYASLYTDRAIAYRREHGFDQMRIALSVGVQLMVRADRASAGVMFSIDTESGFPDIVVINAAWGLGESVVQGEVDPDEYRVFKPLLENGLRPIIGKSLGKKANKVIFAPAGSSPTRSVKTSKRERERWVLTDDDVLQLARWAIAIHGHYNKPMDMEWAKDGADGQLYIVQARPETVQSRTLAGLLKTYTLSQKGVSILSGLAIGDAIAVGAARLLRNPQDTTCFNDGDVLVAENTDPDWVPIMSRASAVVTNHGGRTSHAAIVSRELGLPAVVGCGNATQKIADGQKITVSCAEGSEGYVYEGWLDFEARELDVTQLPEPPVDIMINIASPSAALRWWRLPVKGIGLARMEFIINNIIRVHPLALSRFADLDNLKARREIEKLTRGYADKTDYFVERLAQGIATIAASQYPRSVIVRMSDFKTNEYANLLGGRQFEPKEANPMLGFRGASRYYSDDYRDGFALECRAIKRAREQMGFHNIVIMIPFVRSPEEADRVHEILAENGLKRGENGLQVYMMCEVPSNVFLSEEFAKRYDGFSIGSNDLTQLIMGVDRDSEKLKALFDERNEAVKSAIRDVIQRAHKKGCKVGICGQAPSDYPDFAKFLVDCHIDSMSLNPDSVIPVIRQLAAEGPSKQ
jgi:pyruvate,water dikinase